MIALITGITGQDGHHLTELLLTKGYKVVGIVRSLESKSTKSFNLRFPTVSLVYGDLSDFEGVHSIVRKVQPNEIYNLGGVSDVSDSYSTALETANITGLGLLRILEAVRKSGLTDKIRIYQASSSEIFGATTTFPQNENSIIEPISPYGIAKAFAQRIARQYREDYGMQIATGILYNHEGEFRRHEYVTRKITSNIARIKLGKTDKFMLGNLEARRDWGYAGDYVEAIWKMVQIENPGEYVIATGVTHSVKDFVIASLEAAGLEPIIDKYVELDSTLLRPSPERQLIGQATKARNELGWMPETSFLEIVSTMVENDLRLEAEK